MIQRFGEAALIESTMRADELSAEGDTNGARIWNRIAESAEFLSDSTPVGPGH